MVGRMCRTDTHSMIVIFSWLFQIGSFQTMITVGIEEFISSLNSYIQKTLTCHFLYNCKTVLSSWTLFRGRNFFCLTVTNLKSFDPITGNLFERDSLIIDCLIVSSLSFSFNDSIPVCYY